MEMILGTSMEINMHYALLLIKHALINNAKVIILTF